jgi:hypothetical protein
MAMAAPLVTTATASAVPAAPQVPALAPPEKLEAEMKAYEQALQKQLKKQSDAVAVEA